MSRHEIDTSVSLLREAYDNLPTKQEIDVVEVAANGHSRVVKQIVEKEPYEPDSDLVDAVNLSIALGRPLLLQGEPGCGKTRLAYAVAYALKLPIEEGYVKSTSRGQDLLYSYDAVNRLYDVQLGASGPRDKNNNPRCQQIENYIMLGPLGRAIARGDLRNERPQRSVVLIDEIDKADFDFPNDLLLELDRLEFRVAEAPEIRFKAGARSDLRPIVIVTHNEESELPAAFLRRCIFHYLEFPASEIQLKQILELHHPNNEKLSQRAIAVILRLRELKLQKKPGLSELIDWVGYMAAMNTPVEELLTLPYADILLKNHSDQLAARQELNRE
ncbi:MAG TPA: MoxR family ATPase [Pyrinomonadaceae bacterium]|jgi:MoxR-like ATPase